MTHPLVAEPTIRDLLARAIDDLDAGQEVDLIDLERKCLAAALEAAPVPDLVEAGKVLEQWTAYVESMGSVMGEAEHIAQQMHDTIRALIALATAQAAQIAGLQDPVAVHANMLRGAVAKPTVEQIVHLYGRDALVKALDAAEATTLRDEVERLRGALDQIAAEVPSRRHNGNRNDLIAVQSWNIARTALEGKA